MSESKKLHEASKPSMPPAVSSGSSLDSFVFNDGMQSGSSTGKRILLDTKRLDKSPNKRQFVYQAAATTVAANSSVPEFLYQLTKMLTDDNREIIEWSDGLIKVHNPIQLESEVLQRYFRHSKFSSFQRQLNYFGFRKQAGKGKMAPCSYTNEYATDELRSILYIKRKTSTSSGTKGERSSVRKRPNVKHPNPVSSQSMRSVNPVLAGILQKTSKHDHASQKAIAKQAVGKGIRHGFLPAAKTPTPTRETLPAPVSSSTSLSSLQETNTANNLSELVSNYRNSLTNIPSATNEAQTSVLSRSSSLLDLAMIPAVDTDSDSAPTKPAEELTGWSFVDFPHPEIYPATNEGMD